MKNIRVLPTDKSSILSIEDGILILHRPQWRKGTQNIYITSHNEDINENDYIITKDGRLVQVSYLLSKDLEEASKVILTTDQDLIADGVQAIDDEFLEWFVKNPSCEKVETVFNNRGITGAEKILKTFGEYKIIIPKEEVLLQSSIDGKPIWGEAIKQDTIDTLEYGLLQHIKTCLECNNESQVIRLLEKYGFEKQEGLYSEEDMLEASEYGYNFHKTTQFPEQEFKDSCIRNTQQWLTKFKN